jgi:AcrR family transcriptional regulator
MSADLERRVLDATKVCCERWGLAKVTVDDVAAEARVSRATLYRLFPGGKDVLFEALRLRELEDFFTSLGAHIEGVDEFEELLVRCVVHSTHALRADEHLAAMLASEPGDTLGNLTVDGLPRIIRVATVFLVPLVVQHLPRAEASRLVELLVRLVISYFLAPSEFVDLGDELSARHFLNSHIIPAFQASLRS